MFGAGLSTATLVKAGAALIVAAALYGAAMFYLGKREGVAETKFGALKGAFTRIQDMEKNNASFRALPGRDRCLLLAYYNKLPSSACD